MQADEGVGVADLEALDARPRFGVGVAGRAQMLADFAGFERDCPALSSAPLFRREGSFRFRPLSRRRCPTWWWPRRSRLARAGCVPGALAAERRDLFSRPARSQETLRRRRPSRAQAQCR